MLGDRGPTWQDRSKLPYTEVLTPTSTNTAGNHHGSPEDRQHCTPRHSSCDHQVTQQRSAVCFRDIVVNSATIPANTFILALYAEIMKGDHWGDGTTFRPERFLDSQGLVSRDAHAMPFSIGTCLCLSLSNSGKRQCPGEGLAKVELFLFLSNLLQQFRFQPEVRGGWLATWPWSRASHHLRSTSREALFSPSPSRSSSQQGTERCML